MKRRIKNVKLEPVKINRKRNSSETEDTWPSNEEDRKIEVNVRAADLYSRISQRLRMSRLTSISTGRIEILSTPVSDDDIISRMGGDETVPAAIAPIPNYFTGGELPAIDYNALEERVIAQYNARNPSLLEYAREDVRLTAYMHVGVVRDYITVPEDPLEYADFCKTNMDLTEPSLDEEDYEDENDTNETHIPGNRLPRIQNGLSWITERQVNSMSKSFDIVGRCARRPDEFVHLIIMFRAHLRDFVLAVVKRVFLSALRTNDTERLSTMPMYDVDEAGRICIQAFEGLGINVICLQPPAW